MKALLRRVVEVRDDEIAALLWSCAYCFCVLASFYVLRPLREEMGIAGGVKNLPWMYTGTLVATIATVPLFSALVTRYSRRRFIPVAYRFFALNLAVFFLLFRFMPETSRVMVARTFYVWYSVFNLFVVSVFWGYMADLFKSEQGKRLFGFIAAGGTLGGIAGAGLTAGLVQEIGTLQLLLISALILEIGVQAFRRLERHSAGSPAATGVAEAASAERPLNRTGAFGGFTLVARSGYLLLICLYMLLFTTSSTFAYMEQARIVQAASASPEARTAIFARMDLLVNVLALVVQLFLAGRLVRLLGLGPTIAILPALSLGGFGALLLWPTLGVLMTFQVLRRGTDYAAAKPAREVLFTILDREEKYKAKSFIDTFVYRGGDAVGAWAYKVVVMGGDPALRVAIASVPLTAAWIAVSLYLGARQKRGATASGQGLAPAVA